MNPGISDTLNQQLSSGAALGQQGMMAEAQGNPGAAAQLYDNAIGWITQSMATAQQWGMLIPDGVHAALANAHACAARAKTAMGMPPAAWPHWNQAPFELNQAITQNSRFAPYHAAAGLQDRRRLSGHGGQVRVNGSAINRPPRTLQSGNHRFARALLRGAAARAGATAAVSPCDASLADSALSPVPGQLIAVQKLRFASR